MLDTIPILELDLEDPETQTRFGSLAMPFANLRCDSHVSNLIPNARTWFLECLAVGVTNSNTICIAHALNINRLFIQRDGKAWSWTKLQN